MASGSNENATLNAADESNHAGAEETKDPAKDFVADTFAKFGLNLDLFGGGGTEVVTTEQSQDDSDAKTGLEAILGTAPSTSCKVEALLAQIPDFAFLTDNKLAMNELFP